MNKLEKITIIGLSIFFLITSIVFVSCKKGEKTVAETQIAEKQDSEKKEILYYTCGMHPSVKVTPEDFEAGNNSCPICKMDLIPVYKEESTAKKDEHKAHEVVESQITLSPRARALAQVKTEEIQFRNLTKEINTVGQMVFDERKTAIVSAWIPGRLDELFVDFTGINVKKGKPLVKIYSPNLLTTQEEYLLALETLDKIKKSPNQDAVRAAESLVKAAKKRLLLWGISESQIEELKNSGSTSTHMTIHAPIGGTVVQKHAIEGKYVKEGEPLYQIVDLSNLWMEADIYEYEMAYIKRGQKVTITTPAYPGEIFEGNISFIEPYLNPKTRSVKARVDVPNPKQKLKPGMYVNVLMNSHVFEGIRAPGKVLYICPMCPEVKSETPGDCPNCGMDLVKKEPAPSGTILAVPKEAVLDTGIRKLVYIEKEAGAYVAKEVELGIEAVAEENGKKRKFYAVKSGLSEGIKVVIRANFLIDSQSQITGQAETIYSGALKKGEEKKPPAKHIH